MAHIPIEYTAIFRGSDGHEGSIDLESPGWRNREGLRDAVAFSLQPKPDAALPTICVDLAPLPDGTRRELVYFSRVFGQVRTQANQEVSGPGDQHNLFRLYCIGWHAKIAGRDVNCLSWIYPWQLDAEGKQLTGSVVMADEPPFINELIEHYATKDWPHEPVREEQPA